MKESKISFSLFFKYVLPVWCSFWDRGRKSFLVLKPVCLHPGCPLFGQILFVSDVYDDEQQVWFLKKRNLFSVNLILINIKWKLIYFIHCQKITCRFLENFFLTSIVKSWMIPYFFFLRTFNRFEIVAFYFFVPSDSLDWTSLCLFTNSLIWILTRFNR